MVAASPSTSSSRSTSPSSSSHKFSAEDMMNGNFQERRPPSPAPVPSSSAHSTSGTEQQQQQEDQQSDGVVPYSAMDVLCGTNNYNHPGNRRFRSIIDANLQRYVDAPARADKTKVVCAVLQEIVSTAPCRFLKQDPKSKQWHELDKQASKTKVGHALRVKSRFLPKSKDLQQQQHHHHHPHPHHHHHPHHPAATLNNAGPSMGFPTDPSSAASDHLKKARLLNMFLHDDSLKKPMHPQQYQYQYSTENAKLMMSHELQGLLGGLNNNSNNSPHHPGFFFNNQSNHQPNNMDPSPIPINNMIHNTNTPMVNSGNTVSLVDDDDDDDMASNASSDDSDFLERINELPLSHFGGLDDIGGHDEEEDEEDDDIMPIDTEDYDFGQNVRGEELIQMLDFATAL